VPCVIGVYGRTSPSTPPRTSTQAVAGRLKLCPFGNPKVSRVEL
jgi:hypothetical protein